MESSETDIFFYAKKINPICRNGEQEFKISPRQTWPSTGSGSIQS
jgi:hypothetical protein